MTPDYLLLMTLDAELSFPVEMEHKFSLGRMHTMTGNAGYWLTIARVFCLWSKWMSNLMLRCMTSCTCLNTICS